MAPSPHAALQATLTKTLLSLHTHRAGFPTLPERTDLQSILRPRELELLELYEKHNRLAHEIREINLGLSEAFEGLTVDGDGDGEDGGEMEEVEYKVRAQILAAIVERVVGTGEVLRAVYPGEDGEGDRRILRALSTRDSLSATHAQLSTSINTLTSTLQRTARERIALEKRNIEIASRIQRVWKSLEKGLPDRDGIGTEQERQTWKEDEWKVRVLRGVVMRIVVGSGIDWWSDERWRDLVIKCGEE